MELKYIGENKIQWDWLGLICTNVLILKTTNVIEFDMHLLNGILATIEYYVFGAINKVIDEIFVGMLFFKRNELNWNE